MSEIKRPSVFAAFSVRNYRFQWPADLLTSWAFEMETIILSWYILVETGSVVLLTLFAALNFTGTLIAPVLGTIGDRIGHRNLLAMMRTAYAVLAGTQMTLLLTGYSTPLFVFMLAMIIGLIRPSDLGMRGALVASIMAPAQLIGAMSVSRTTGDTARIAGALSGAGLVALIGMGHAYVVIVCLYVAATILTLQITPRLKPKREEGVAVEPQGTPLHDLKEGLGYVWKTPLLLAIMWVAFVANLSAYPLTNGLLPYIVRNIFSADQTVLGYLSASFSAGGLAGSICLSMLSGFRMARLLMVTTTLWYAMLLVFANVQSVPAAIACLLIAGFLQSFSMISIAVILMRTSDERFRGRVMGVRMLAIYGMPIGLLAAGSLIEKIGFPAMAAIYVGIGFATMAFIVLRWRNELWRTDAPANAK